MRALENGQLNTSSFEYIEHQIQIAAVTELAPVCIVTQSKATAAHIFSRAVMIPKLYDSSLAI